MENEKKAYKLLKSKISDHIRKYNIEEADLWFRGESQSYDR